MSDIRDLEYWKAKCEFAEKERDYWIENTKEINVELKDLNLKLEIANLDTKLVDYWIRQFKQKEKELEKITADLIGERHHYMQQMERLNNMVGIEYWGMNLLDAVENEFKKRDEYKEALEDKPCDLYYTEMIGSLQRELDESERVINLIYRYVTEYSEHSAIISIRSMLEDNK